jgi:hypothetical protein
MMKVGVFRKLLLAALAAGALASPAYAQMTGSHLGGLRVDVPDYLTDPDERARYSLVKMGECMVKENRNRALKYLASFPESKDSYKLANQWLRQDDCLSSGDITMQDSDMRAAIFGALYRTEYRLKGPLDVANAKPVDYSQGNAITTLDPMQKQVVAIRQMGDCVVRAQPAAAHLLVVSDVHTDPEAGAYRAIVPALGPCISNGVQIKLTKLSLYGIVAEAIYRLSRSAEGLADVADPSS